MLDRRHTDPPYLDPLPNEPPLRRSVNSDRMWGPIAVITAIAVVVIFLVVGWQGGNRTASNMPRTATTGLAITHNMPAPATTGQDFAPPPVMAAPNTHVPKGSTQ